MRSASSSRSRACSSTRAAATTGSSCSRTTRTIPSDPELRVWGEHALAGTPGAQVIPELEPRPGPAEIVSPKRAYGAFDGTGLDEQLKALGVDEVVVTGQHTHICVRHSSYGALIRGYRVTVPRDAVCTFEGVNEDEALEYLVMAYGADVTDVAALTGAPVQACARATALSATLRAVRGNPARD